MERCQMGIEENLGKFFQYIKKTITNWAEQETITENDLYHFFKTVSKVSENLGLTNITVKAKENLNTISKGKQTLLEKKEWQRYITPFMSFIDKITLPPTKIIDNDEKDFILLIDDDVDFVTMTKQILETEGYFLIVAPNGKRGIEMIYDFKPSLILLDIHLPDMNGFQILESILTKLKKNYTPIIVMSGDDSKQNRILSYEMGAIDFIAKPIDRDLFVANIKNRLRHRKDIEQSIVIDELTGVYNRKYLQTRLNQMFKQYHRDHFPFSLVLLDLDHFKQVNDKYGHIVGDEVLKKFANIANNIKRENDIICRYGGEEFVILLPNTTRENVFPFLQRFQQILSEQHFYANGTNFQVTFSAGITEVSEHNLHVEKILDEADKALYYAKQSGRNRAVIYDTSLQTLNNQLKISIIIVEDSQLIRYMLVNYFSNWKPSERFEINVLSFSNGIEFLQSNWYKPKEKFVILLDGIMPGMDGLEVLKKVRENYSTDNVLISMLTGRKGEEHIIHALRNGADDYIVKPFEIEEVAARILRLINKVFE